MTRFIPPLGAPRWMRLTSLDRVRGAAVITDVDDMPAGSRLHADVGVVGSGFAGMELAHRLGRSGLRVVMVESGRWAFDPATQELARVRSVGKPIRAPSPDSPFTPYLAPELRGESRLRQVGGTSTMWTGKWREFDDLDFAHRPWIPFSGWPTSRRDLLPYYRQVARDYGLGDFDAFAGSDGFAGARSHLAAAGLSLSFHFWQRSTMRLAERFRPWLEGSATVTLVCGATATQIVLADDRQRVERLELRTLDGREFVLQADRFVLALGGLEGARLLLASSHQLPRGVGNAHGLVGRFHMDHPKTKRVRLRPGPTMPLIAEWTKGRPRPRFQVSLALADDVQRRERLLDHAVYLSPVYTYDLGAPDGAAARLKEAIGRLRPGAAAAASIELLRSGPAAGKLLQRRWHGGAGGPVAYYTGSMYLEQAPNPESSLRLSDELDPLGVPRLVVDWRLTELDHASLAATCRRLTEAFRAAGLGELDFGPEPLTLDEMVDAAHHIGATRMAETPEEGVVDRDCRVFGTTNLYIASSSVFPTGHSAAPTMTILALARRLADHLLGLRADTADGGSSALRRRGHAVR